MCSGPVTSIGTRNLAVLNLFRLEASTSDLFYLFVVVVGGCLISQLKAAEMTKEYSGCSATGGPTAMNNPKCLVAT